MAGAKGQERTGQRAVKHEIRQIATEQYHEVRTYTQPEVESASYGKGDRRAKMNGYEMMAESYRQLVKHGEIDKETADKEIRVYDFLATCDSDDLCRMVDSSAFNDIIRAFVEMAVKNADIDEDSRNKVVGQLRWLFDEKMAKEVLEGR
jgi:hypothetical protein